MNGPLDPQTTNFRDLSTYRIWRAASAAFNPYSFASMWPICQGPSISLPRHQYCTFQGSLMPCCLRRSLQRVPCCTLQYSTTAAAPSGVPVPTFKPINGSVPTALHHARNSFVPNWFVSIESQAFSSLRGRFCAGPTPSSQL